MRNLRKFSFEYADSGSMESFRISSSLGISWVWAGSFGFTASSSVMRKTEGVALEKGLH